MKNLRRRRVNSKFDEVDFEAEAEEIGEEEREIWVSRMRNRLKEMEEIKELERKAEELQSRKDGGEGEDGFGEEETEEEEKNESVKKTRKGKKQYVEWARNQGQYLTSDDGFFRNPVVKYYYKNHIKADQRWRCWERAEDMTNPKNAYSWMTIIPTQREYFKQGKVEQFKQILEESSNNEIEDVKYEYSDFECVGGTL